MQQHIHSCQVEGGGVLFLTKDFIGVTVTGGTEQQGSGPASRVIHVLETGLSGNDDFGKNLAHFLRRIKLSGFLAGTGRELTNHILVGITQDVDILRFVQAEVNAIERNQHVADEFVLVIGRLAKFRRCQIDIGEKATEVIHALVADSAVLNLFEAALQLRQDVFLVTNGLNNRRIQILGFYEVAQILHAEAFDFRFKFFLIGGPCLLERKLILTELVVDVQLYLLRQVFIKNEAQGKVHEVPGSHVASEFVGHFPQLGTQALLQLFAHIVCLFLFPAK